MSEIRLNFLNWRPDLEDYGHDGLTTADNVIHQPQGYVQLVKKSDASATSLGSVSSSIVSTQIRRIGPLAELAGQVTVNTMMLARMENATLASLTLSHAIEDTNEGITSTLVQSGGTATAIVTAPALVSFAVCELGDFVFAAAHAVGFGTTPAVTAVSANITGTMTLTSLQVITERHGEYISNTLTSSSVSAMTCGVISQFVVVSETGARTSVRWCEIGDATSWPEPNTDEARAAQAGRQTMPPELGMVTGIAPGDFFGYVFQERGISKMTYVGGDVVFAFDTMVTDGVGCFGYNRFVVVDGIIFFESNNGYYMLSNGQLKDIGYGRVSETYPPTGSITDTQHNVVANEAIGCVFFESQSLCYNYKTDQWTRVPALDGYPLYRIRHPDGIIGTVVITHGATDTDAVQHQEGGTAQTATLETAETDLNQGGRAEIDGVRPRVNGGTVAVSVGVRNDLDDAVTYSTGTSINSRTGMANFRSAANRAEGRYQRVKLTITGGFETALGADVEFNPSGNV